MKSPFKKLVLVLVVVGGWYAYLHWMEWGPALGFGGRPNLGRETGSITGRIVDSASDVLDGVAASGQDDAPSSTVVYQWRDASGGLHVSNTPPSDVENVEVKRYRSDQNVVRSTETGTLSEEQAEAAESRHPGGVFDAYGNALDKARAARREAESRNRELGEALSQQDH